MPNPPKDFIANFVRVIPKQGQEAWMNKMNKMNWLCSEAEYQMVKRGYRPVATTNIDQNDLGEKLERFNQDGLIFTPLRKSGYYEGFSHHHKPVIPGESFYWYGCLTRNKKDAQKFKKADIGNNKGSDHRTIGLMLGFPDCCAKYFDKEFKNNYDPIWVGKKGKIAGYPEANTLLRYFGARITHHFSCSPACEPTRKIGKVWFKVMQEIDKELAQKMYDLLAGPITWDSYHGVVQVETPYFLGLTQTFPYWEKPRIIEWQGKKDKKIIKP
jgi:hypothetical protein